MQTTCPAQQSWACIRMVWMLGRLARARTSVSGILSCHTMPRRRLRLVVWKWFSFVAWRLNTVQVSQPYSSVVRTTALYTLILVSWVMQRLYQTFCWSLAKAALALASLVFTSSSITTFLERVLPRYMTLSTAASRCPLTLTFGST